MFEGVSDHELLAGGVGDLVAEDASAAARLARLLAFHERRLAEPADPLPLAGSRHHRLTPLQETIVEVGELWSLSPGQVRSDLQQAMTLSRSFPGVWELCLAGRLDGYRAGLIADAATRTSPRPTGRHSATGSPPG